MSAEPETRRSARATKGQHKALEQLDQLELPKKRANKKGKKAAPEPEEEPEEVIRCVCGATEQDEDSEEAWIACDQCGVWQHNICVGLSRFEDECPENYWCEQCRPENHKVLLDGLARGEKPWENWRRIAEEEIAREKRDKKKGHKKGKAKRVSDERKASPAPEPKKAKPSPAPENKKSKTSPAPVIDNKKAKPSPAPETSKKEPKAQVAASKRKARDESQDKEPKKARKLSGTQTVPVPPGPARPKYTSPEDLAAKISDLSPESRQGPAKALSKSLTSSIGAAEKKGLYVASDGVTVGARAERFALQIERAVHDSHPNFAAYTAQIKTLVFNLKNNLELAVGLLKGTLTPLALAGMTTEELASKELQKETAEMKARAEKQSILINEEGPRVRRTHKGEEIVGEDDSVAVDDALPPVRRSTIVRETTSESARPPADEDEQNADNEPHVELPAHIEQSAPSRAPLQVDTKQQQQHSPKTDFDINKVFSSVKSPTATAQRRPSALPVGGPGVDPEVDRMLQDDGTESPPYSPTEENDPDVVWKGNLIMNTVAEVPVVAKYVGGAKLNETIGLPWTSLIPPKLSVAGRIDETKATEYLCGLRYSAPTDIVVVRLEPTSKSAKTAILRIINYFVSKKRYGVVGDKGIGQVRDTYLIPVMPGTGGHPEFILNLEDNYLPQTRTEPMLLCVFVYRNDPSTLQRQHGTNTSGHPVSQSPVVNTPTPPQGGFAQRNPSMSAPQFSPTSPQGTFPTPNHPPARNGQGLSGPSAPQTTPLQAPQPPPQPQPAPQNGPSLPQDAQAHGERVARQILGELIDSPTVHFLLPHASRMQPKEWELVRDVYLRDPAARTDLNQLSALLAKESSARNSERGPGTQQQSPSQQQQQQQSPPQTQHHGPPPSAQGQTQPPPPAPLRAPIVQQQTPIPPPPVPRQTPIPPPQIPRQTPIPPPQIPPPHAPPPAPAA